MAFPPGSRDTRRAIARWSDGTEREVLTWYADYADVRISRLMDLRVIAETFPARSRVVGTGSICSA